MSKEEYAQNMLELITKKSETSTPILNRWLAVIEFRKSEPVGIKEGLEIAYFMENIYRDELSSLTNYMFIPQNDPSLLNSLNE